MLHLTPTSIFLYLNLYSTKSYNKYCSNITAMLLHYVSAIILQVFLYVQNLILHIYYVIILLQLLYSIYEFWLIKSKKINKI